MPAYTFNGKTYTDIGVDSNGYLVAGGGTAEDNNCCDLPDGADPAAPNNVMAPFWTDLNGDGTACAGRPGIFVGSLTDGVNTWLVVEYRVNAWGTNDRRVFQTWIGLNGVQDISYAYDPTNLPAQPAGQDLLYGAENEVGDGEMVAGAPTEDQVITSTDPAPGDTVAYSREGARRQEGPGHRHHPAHGVRGPGHHHRAGHRIRVTRSSTTARGGCGHRPATAPSCCRDQVARGQPRASRASVSSATSASSWTSADDVDLLVGAVERAGGQAGLAVDELGDPGVDGLGGDDPPRGDRLGLADPVHPVDRLGLLGVGPRQLGEHDVGRDLEVDADAGRGERADDDLDLGVVGERVDRLLLARPSGLVAADRGVPDAARANVSSAVSITSMCLAKNTTLPTLRASCAA